MANPAAPTAAEAERKKKEFVAYMNRETSSNDSGDGGGDPNGAKSKQSLNLSMNSLTAEMAKLHTRFSVFKKPPFYKKGSGKVYSIPADKWYEKSAPHFDGSPSFRDPVEDFDKMDQQVVADIYYKLGTERDQQLAKKLKINFTESGDMINDDLKKIDIAQLVQKVGIEAAKHHERMEALVQDNRAVTTLVFSHSMVREVRGKYDVAGMHKQFQNIMSAIVERSANLYAGQELAGLNPLILLEPHEYKLAVESSIKKGSGGNSYVARSRKVKETSLLLKIDPKSKFHKSKPYGQISALWKGIERNQEKITLKIRNAANSPQSAAQRRGSRGREKQSRGRRVHQRRRAHKSQQLRDDGVCAAAGSGQRRHQPRFF